VAAKDGKVALIRRVPLFAACPQRVLEEVSARSDEVDLRAGKVLVREGEYGDEFFVVSSGRVRMERHGNRVATYGPGEFIGEMALLDGRPRTCTAIAEEPTRLLIIQRRDMRFLIDSHPSVQEQVMVVMRLESLA
jgi:CRP-like cAMP-binding protein